MKKALSILLAVCLCFTALSSVMFASAEATVNEKTIDLTQSVRIGTDSDKGHIGTTFTDDGMVVDIENYNAKFVGQTSKLWLKGTMLALKYDDGNYVFLENGKEYVINVVYDVTYTNGATFFPAIGLVYNDNTAVANALADNGSYVLAARQHEHRGSYSMCATKVAGNGRPIRLAFYGVGTVVVKAVTISTVETTPDEIDLSKSASIIAADKVHYSSFAPATATTPFSVTMKSGTSAAWLPFHTAVDLKTLKSGAQWLKTLFSLKTADDSFYKMQAGHKYKVAIEYAATAIADGVTTQNDGCRPAVAVVYNNNASGTSDNGSIILAADVYKEATLGTHKTYTTGMFNGVGDRPLRLALGGRECSIEVYSVKIYDYEPVPVVTYNDNGNTIAKYQKVGSALDVPAKKADYNFMGWYDNDAFEGDPINTVSSDVTVYANWEKISDNVRIGTQTRNNETRLIMKLTDSAEAIENYDSISFELVVDGEKEVVSVDCVYDSFYNNGNLVTAESLNCTYVAILEIGNITAATSVTACGSYTVGETTVTGAVRTVK